MNHRSISKAAVALLSLSLAVGCRAPGATLEVRPGPHTLPTTLSEPQGSDWSLQRLSSRGLAARQAQHLTRRIQAFPTAGATWPDGVSLTALGCSATDSVPNGLALAYPTLGSLVNKAFFLTREGKFIRIDRTNPADAATLDLGRTFSRTSITLSPYARRAYVLADDGTLLVVDTNTMTPVGSAKVGGGYGIAPYLDRFASAPDDSHDVVYVPANDGQVHRFTCEPTADGARLSGPVSHPVATQVTPLVGTRKLAAPAIVVDGVIYIGDQGGSFHVYDTANPAGSLSYGLGAPVNTPPSLELQDGSYTVTDQEGLPKAVDYGRPVYAFVNAGASCVWINLHDTSVATSLPLRIDDNQAGKTYGYLSDYSFSTAGTTEVLAAVDGGNLNTETPDRPLPGRTTVHSNDYLVPAETNTYEEAGQAKGGPIVSYIRWTSNQALAAGAIINRATLTLTPAFSQACRVPEIRSASPYRPGSATLWTSDTLSNAERPQFGADNLGLYLTGAMGGRYNNVTFKADKPYQWDVTRAFGGTQSHYALGLAHNAGGDAVLWPEGPVGGGVGKKAKKEDQVEAAKFHTNPQLTLQVSATRLPTPTLETPPMIDALNKKVYVFYTNTLYALDFSSPAAFSDTDPTGQKHTLFNLAHMGDTANGGGATYDGKKRFVGNFTAPLLSHTGTAAYVVSRYPTSDSATPTSWSYAVSKIALPLTPTANQLTPGSPVVSNLQQDASGFMLLEPRSKVAANAHVYLGLGNGKVYKFEP